MAEKTETESLRDVLTQAQHFNIEGIPVVITPKDFSVHTLERLQEIDAPRRIVRKVQANDVRGFIDYVNDFMEDETKLYAASWREPTLIARMDDHAVGGPSHNTHEVKYACPFTHEWTTWTGSNKKAMPQKAFAEFIESNLLDIIEPTGADMLQMVLNFSDVGSAEFKSAVRLDNGRVQYQFIEKDNATQVVFPSELKLALPVFEGQPARYPIVAKLRYRVPKRDEETLALWFELTRPDLVQRQAYEHLIEDVQKSTNLSIFRAL